MSISSIGTDILVLLLRSVNVKMLICDEIVYKGNTIPTTAIPYKRPESTAITPVSRPRLPGIESLLLPLVSFVALTSCVTS